MNGVVVSIAEVQLARKMKRAIAVAMDAAIASASQYAALAGEFRVVRLRARKTLVRLTEEGALAGALVIVRVDERNARHLAVIVEGARAAGAMAVQMVWDGEAPPRSRVERHIFTVLERARATPSGPPVILAKSDAPPFALRILVASRHRKDDRS